MSKAGSSDLLDMVDMDMDDLLGTLGDDDIAAAAGLVTTPSFAEQDAKGGSSEDAGDLQESLPAVKVTHEKEEAPHVEGERADEDVKQEGDTSAETQHSGHPRKLEVNVDASPLNKQEGLDRFKRLEQKREEQKKQLQIEEQEVMKAKMMYTGKKWEVKQAGPMRPQEAGELAVACAVKPGEKKSPREEIEELTRQEDERKKKEKALTTAVTFVTPPLPAKPALPPRPRNEKKEEDEQAAPPGGADGEKTEGGAQVSEAVEANNDGDGEDKHEEDVKTCETDGQEIQGGEHGAAESALGAHRGEADEESDSAKAKPGVKEKVKDKLRLLSCFNKGEGVREPHKPTGRFGVDVVENPCGGSTGELSDTSQGGQNKPVVLLASPTKGVFED